MSISIRRMASGVDSIQLHRVFYVSRTLLQDDYDIQKIVQASRTHNPARNITGALAFSGDHFAQLLEGPQPALEALLTSIRRDPRHAVLWQWPIAPAAERWYPSWWMGYLYNDRLEDVVRKLSEVAPSLPKLETFVPALFSTSRLNRRSQTPPLPRA